MMPFALSLALVISGWASSALGAELQPSSGVSHPIGSDPRVRSIVYAGESPVRVTVGPYPALIALEPGEAIADVASDGNQASPKTWNIVWRSGQNYLFVQPGPGARPASLTLKTAQRAYLFDLWPDLDATLLDPTRTALLVVTLPHPPENKSVSRVASIDSIALVPRRNRSYTLEIVSEVEDIRPRAIFDDGRFTYMRFPNNLMIPAIYKSTPKSHSEQLMNSHLEGDWVVLHGIAPLWNLRLGGSVLGVFNEQFDPEGLPPENGMTLPGLLRSAP
jgi:type IV secretion system protein VirB9